MASVCHMLHRIIDFFPLCSTCARSRKTKVHQEIGLSQSEAHHRYPLLLSEYKFGQEVGHGAHGVVYQASCLPCNEVVAVKVFDIGQGGSEIIEEVMHECHMMKLLNHPNILKAHCSFAMDTRVYCVMPYLEGNSCKSILSKAFPNGMEQGAVVAILKESLKALEYLHKQGIIYGDLKAANLLIGRNGDVKLGDFGTTISMFDASDEKKRHVLVGSPFWMAPEVIKPSLEGFNHKIDIWSFGILALELAQGYAPLSLCENQSAISIFTKILVDVPPQLDSSKRGKFSKAFNNMVHECLNKDPKQRPSTTELLHHPLFKQTRRKPSHSETSVLKEIVVDIV